MASLWKHDRYSCSEWVQVYSSLNLYTAALSCLIFSNTCVQEAQVRCFRQLFFTVFWNPNQPRCDKRGFPGLYDHWWYAPDRSRWCQGGARPVKPSPSDAECTTWATAAARSTTWATTAASWSMRCTEWRRNSQVLSMRSRPIFQWVRYLRVYSTNLNIYSYLRSTNKSSI